jgi:hypothetical protein
MLAGGLFVLIGLFFVIPMAGLFGVVWTLFALIGVGSSAYNFFSEEGLSSYEINVESDHRDEYQYQQSKPEDDFETKLRKLNRLKEDGLLTEEEYQKKRTEIIDQKW